MQRVISDSNIVKKNGRCTRGMQNNIVRRTKSESAIHDHDNKTYFLPKLKYKQKKHLVKMKSTHNSSKEFLKVCQDFTYAYELSKKQTNVELYFSVLFFVYMLDSHDHKNQKLRLGLITLAYFISKKFL